MTDTIQATLASWSTFVLPTEGFTSKVTKINVERTLRKMPRKVEFDAIASPFQRGGYFFIDEVPGKTIELRYNEGRSLMMIEVDTDGTLKRIR